MNWFSDSERFFQLYYFFTEGPSATERDRKNEEYWRWKHSENYYINKAGKLVSYMHLVCLCEPRREYNTILVVNYGEPSFLETTLFSAKRKNRKKIRWPEEK